MSEEKNDLKSVAAKYLDWYAKQSKIVRILLCLLYDVPTNLARFFRSARKDSVLGMVLAVVLAIFGGWLLFIVDIICIAATDNIFWIDSIEEQIEKEEAAEEKAEAAPAEQEAPAEAPAEQEEAEEAPAEEAPAEEKAEGVDGEVE